MPFDDVFLDTISHAGPEPVVGPRAVALRVVFGAIGVAFLGNRLLRRVKAD